MEAKTTISGVYSNKPKTRRRQKALERLQSSLSYYKRAKEESMRDLKNPLQKAFAPDLTEAEVTAQYDGQIGRIEKEISILKERI